MRRATLALFACLTLAGCASPAPSTPPATTTPSAAPTVRPSPLPDDFVRLSDVDPSIVQDIRYAGDHNFVGRPIDGYEAPRCLLTKAAAQALHEAQTAARSRGYSLKVYDCYRPARAGQDFVDWAKDLDDQAMKGEFYPQEDKARLFQDGYVGGPKTSHSRGSTVDLTLVPVPTPTQPPFRKGQPLLPCTGTPRFPDNSIDMGTGFDCFDPRSHTLDSRITGTARENRLLLKEIMTDAGFVNYANEWWHYDFPREPHPSTYYNFPVS